MYSVASIVDIGVFEKQNDDRTLVGKNLIADGSYQVKVTDNFLIAALCDGVGGLSGGYKAAEITLNFFSYLNRPNVEASTITSAIQEANRRVLDLQSKESGCSGMRTTITGTYIFNDSFILFNVGDSRTYRFRYKYLMQLSKDDSLIQDMIDIGVISSEQATTHPQRNIINKCIGNNPAPVPKVVDYCDDFLDDDILFMCSDGISDVLSITELQEIILQHKNDEDLTACCRHIIESAINNGAKDNMSVILIRKDEENV